MPECRDGVGDRPPLGGARDPGGVVWMVRVEGKLRVWDWAAGPPSTRLMGPVRTPASSDLSRHVPVATKSMTTGGVLGLESGLEHDLVRVLDRRSDVVWLVEQPMRLRFVRRRNGRAVRHVPDLLSVHDDRRVVVWDARPAGRQDDLFCLKAQLTAEACAAVGWGYEVFAGLSPVERANLLWVDGARQEPAWAAAASLVVWDFLTSGDRTLGEVLALDKGAGHLVSTLWHLIWRGAVHCDLSTPITVGTPLRWCETAAVR